LFLKTGSITFAEATHDPVPLAWPPPSRVSTRTSAGKGAPLAHLTLAQACWRNRAMPSAIP
jgi:hypothetical protein